MDMVVKILQKYYQKSITNEQLLAIFYQKWVLKIVKSIRMGFYRYFMDIFRQPRFCWTLLHKHLYWTGNRVTTRKRHRAGPNRQQWREGCCNTSASSLRDAFPMKRFLWLCSLESNNVNASFGGDILLLLRQNVETCWNIMLSCLFARSKLPVGLISSHKPARLWWVCVNTRCSKISCLRLETLSIVSSTQTWEWVNTFNPILGMEPPWMNHPSIHPCRSGRHPSYRNPTRCGKQKDVAGRVRRAAVVDVVG